MSNWIEPSDSPIWRSLSETHPNLEMTVKQKVFLLLQDSGIPPTNKIFPWVVETMINRVSMEMLGKKLATVEQSLSGLPGHIAQAVNQSVSTPVQAIQSNQSTVERLRGAASVAVTKCNKLKSIDMHRFQASIFVK